MQRYGEVHKRFGMYGLLFLLFLCLSIGSILYEPIADVKAQSPLETATISSTTVLPTMQGTIPLLATETPTPCIHCDDFLRIGYLNAPAIRTWSHYPQLFDHSYTHLILSQLLPQVDGGIEPSDAVLSFHTDLVQQAQTNNSKVLISIGGGTVNYTIYIEIANSAIARQRFIDAILDTLRGGGYDGVDLNFEGWDESMDESHRDQIRQLMVDVAQAVKEDNPTLLVTMTLAPLYYLTMGASCEMVNSDLFELAHHMSYGFNLGDFGANGPFREPERIQWLYRSLIYTERSVWGAFDYLISQGCNPSKMTGGLPFYTTDLSAWSQERDDLDWSLVTLDEDTLEKQRPSEGYWVHDEEAVAAKVTAYKNLGLRGVMVWQVGQEGIGGELSQSLYAASVVGEVIATLTTMPTATTSMPMVATSTPIPTATPLPVPKHQIHLPLIPGGA